MDAVQPGHHQVDDEQVDLLRLQDLDRLVPVVGFEHPVSLLGQVDLHRVGGGEEDVKAWSYQELSDVMEEFMDRLNELNNP